MTIFKCEVHCHFVKSTLIYLFYKFIYILFIYFWLHWVFVAARRPSLVVASRSFSCCGARALGVRASVVVARGLSSCGSRALEHSSVVVAHGLCSVARGIFLDQGSNPCPLHL